MVFWIGLQYLKNNTLYQKKSIKMWEFLTNSINSPYLNFLGLSI